MRCFRVTHFHVALWRFTVFISQEIQAVIHDMTVERVDGDKNYVSFEYCFEIALTLTTSLCLTSLTINILHQLHMVPLLIFLLQSLVDCLTYSLPLQYTCAVSIVTHPCSIFVSWCLIPNRAVNYITVSAWKIILKNRYLSSDVRKKLWILSESENYLCMILADFFFSHDAIVTRDLMYKNRDYTWSHTQPPITTMRVTER